MHPLLNGKHFPCEAVVRTTYTKHSSINGTEDDRLARDFNFLNFRSSVMRRLHAWGFPNPMLSSVHERCAFTLECLAIAAQWKTEIDLILLILLYFFSVCDDEKVKSKRRGAARHGKAEEKNNSNSSSIIKEKTDALMNDKIGSECGGIYVCDRGGKSCEWLSKRGWHWMMKVRRSPLFVLQEK